MNELSNEQLSIRRKYSVEQIKHFVELWKKSGKNKKHFCEEHKINYHTFIDWSSTRRVKRLHSDQPRSGKRKVTTDFIPVKVSDKPQPVHGSPVIELSLFASGERRILFYTKPDAVFFKSLLHC